MLTNAIIFSLLSMLAFGVAGPTAKEIIQKFGPLRASVLRSIVSVTFLALVLFILDISFLNDIKWIGIGALIATLSYSGYIFLMYSLSYGKVGVVAPIASGRIIIMAIIGFLFLSESVNTIKIITLLMVFIGIIISSTDFKAFSKSNIFKWRSGVPLALLTALGWGVTMPFFQLPSFELGAMYYAFIIEVVILLAAITHGILEERQNYFLNWKPYKKDIFKTRAIIMISVTGLSVGLGTLFLNLALETGHISIASAIIGASAIVALFTSALLLKERLTAQQYTGAIIVTLGILLPIFTLFN